MKSTNVLVVKLVETKDLKEFEGDITVDIDSLPIFTLLKNNVRLNETGQVEVLDSDGNVRYDTDQAHPLSVDQAVEEFLATNNYFKSAAPAGSGSTGNKQPSTSREVKLMDLDMTSAKDRKIYADQFMAKGIRKFTQ